MPEYPVTQARLHVEEHASPRASAPVIVLIHGWACDSTDWDELVPLLSRELHVVTLDLRGHGKSSTGPGYLLPDLSVDVTELLDERDLDDVVLVGHSAGAEVAVAAAANDAAGGAGRVRALISVDPAYGFDSAAAPALGDIVARMHTTDPTQVAADYFAVLDAESATAVKAAARHRRLALSSRAEVTAAMFEGFAFGEGSIHFRPDIDRAHGARHVPLLGVYRNEQRGAVGREFAVRPGDRVEVYDGTGHWPHQDRPERFVADVLAWLAAIGVTGADTETPR